MSLVDVDDVQRAIWALEGRCPGCGCKKEKLPHIHLKDCAYENFDTALQRCSTNDLICSAYNYYRAT
jgi:hypothetical protein